MCSFDDKIICKALIVANPDFTNDLLCVFVNPANTTKHQDYTPINKTPQNQLS